MVKYFKSRIQNKFKKTINQIIDLFFLIPFLENPLPKNPFWKNKIADKNIYLKLHQEAIKKVNTNVEKHLKYFWDSVSHLSILVSHL